MNQHKTAVITGATGGIGSAVARRFLENGVSVYLLGRRTDTLEALKSEYRDSSGPSVHLCKADFNKEGEWMDTLEPIRNEAGIHYLVHCAAVHITSRFEETDLSDLDKSFRINFRAPFILTRALLDQLVKGNGDIVFVNSSAIFNTRKSRIFQYTASKSALKAMADSIRTEFNDKGIRVMTVFPGKTATSMQQSACREAGLPYKPEKMLQPEDVAAMIYKSVTAPKHVEVTDIYMRPSTPYEQ